MGILQHGGSWIMARVNVLFLACSWIDNGYNGCGRAYRMRTNDYIAQKLKYECYREGVKHPVNTQAFKTAMCNDIHSGAVS